MFRTFNVRACMKAVALTTVCLGCAQAGLAGPLSPPTGPVAPSMKTLTEVEPRIAINQQNTPGDSGNEFIINNPGSYYLTGMVGVGANKNGIRINASHVTIDLNGYTLFGYAGSLDGITAGNSFRLSITIRNGVVRTFGGDGIDLYIVTPPVPQGVRLENVQCNDNGGNGAKIDDGTVLGCVFQNNAATGLTISSGVGNSQVRECAFNQNQGVGVYGNRTSVSNSAARGNSDTGVQISEGTVSFCTAVDNGTGISVGPGVIIGCMASGNTVGLNVHGLAKDNTIQRTAATAGSVGIMCNIRCRVEGNNVSFCATGVQAPQPNSLIIGNSFTACGAAVNTVAGNRVGTIATGTSAAAINGNSGGGLGTTDPTANIIY